MTADKRELLWATGTYGASNFYVTHTQETSEDKEL